MTGVCTGRTAFLREKRRILRFRQTPFSAYGIFLQNPANFPFRFFSYGKRGIRIKKATRHAINKRAPFKENPPAVKRTD